MIVSRLFAEAVLLDDGHVEFTHQCVNGPETTVLPNTKWRVVQASPLTVEPSVHCRRCDWHGWIEGGVARAVHATAVRNAELNEPRPGSSN